MAIQFEPLQTQSLAKQIADKLRAAILSGQLKVDERLPTEEELAAKFSVSRPTIREALKRLAAQNLVRSRRGPTGGTFIKRPSSEEMHASLSTSATLMVTLEEFDFDSIAEARREMEQLCLRLAVERRNQSHLDRMSVELELQKTAISDEEFCASDVRFHRALVDATGNPVLQFNMVTVIEALQPLMNMIANRTRDRQVVFDFHRALFDALNEQSFTKAELALNGLIDYLSEQFRLPESN